MTGKTSTKQKEPTFTQTEAAEILGTVQSNISRAVNTGIIDTKDVGKRFPEIPASELISYAKRTGKDVEKVTKEIKKRTKSSNQQLLKWFLVGLGLWTLYNKLSN